MSGIREIELELNTSLDTIQGKLLLREGFWRFTSDHPAFERLFPSLSVYSVSRYRKDEERAEVYGAVADAVGMISRYE